MAVAGCRWRRYAMVPQLIASLREHPTPEGWAEMMEQIAHQWTCYSSAYAAVPHLLELAKIQRRIDDPTFFFSLGMIAEPVDRTDPVPEDLRADFEKAMSEAAALSLEALLTGRHDVKEFVYLLQSAAALHHRREPGMHLQGLVMDNLEAYCPNCDAYLLAPVDEARIELVPGDESGHAPPRRGSVQPRPAPDVNWSAQNPPTDDFSWLAALCREARQPQVLTWIRHLSGDARCPTATFVLMSAVARE